MSTLDPQLSAMCAKIAELEQQLVADQAKLAAMNAAFHARMQRLDAELAVAIAKIEARRGDGGEHFQPNQPTP